MVSTALTSSPVSARGVQFASREGDIDALSGSVQVQGTPLLHKL